MKNNLLLLLLAAAAWSLPAAAQITERDRPAEWDGLVAGGRYMDRFLPMPDGKLSDKVWGAKDVVPRYADNGIEDPEISFWGGNILRGDDGRYHMFVCGWPENSAKGHMEWPNSTVYHAVSDVLSGPYSIRDTIGKGHNPEAFVLRDGRIVVYVIDGYYIADGMEGPWTYGRFDFDPRDRRIIEGLSNLTFARRQDGSYLMVCRGGGVWISRDGLSPYEQITEKRIYPAVEGEFEDPVVWRDSLQYHLIVNDWLGRIAFYQRSKDGVHWVTEQGEAYVPGISRHRDGRVENWFKYERAKVFQDRDGRAVQMNFAVIDTIKWEDRPNDNHSSKNICIPLRRDLLLDVLGAEPADGSAPVRVRIRAEKGFRPARDLDISSLRFGAFGEVNFGRGGKPVSWERCGRDLIVTFDGKGCCITADEFAPKMLGRDRRGEPVIGYARLPYVDYTPALLSARRPVYDAGAGRWSVEVKNFGLSASDGAVVMRIVAEDVTVAESEVPSLRPYEKRILTLAGGSPSAGGARMRVEFYRDGRRMAVDEF